MRSAARSLHKEGRKGAAFGLNGVLLLPFIDIQKSFYHLASLHYLASVWTGSNS